MQSQTLLIKIIWGKKNKGLSCFILLSINCFDFFLIQSAPHLREYSDREDFCLLKQMLKSPLTFGLQYWATRQ